MKRTGTVIILSLIVLAAFAGIWYVYSLDKKDPVVYQTENPSTNTIIRKTVATGSIVPKEEILIKPNISGVIEKIYIEAGEYVKQGDLIAQIRVHSECIKSNQRKE